MTNRQEFHKSHCERVWNIAPDCPTFFPNRLFLREAREKGSTYAIAMQNSLCLPALRHMTRFAGAKSMVLSEQVLLDPATPVLPAWNSRFTIKNEASCQRTPGPFPDRVHLRGTGLCRVLGRAWCMDDRCVNNRTAVHDESCGVQPLFHVIEHLAGDIVLFQQVTEVQEVMASGVRSMEKSIFWKRFTV